MKVIDSFIFFNELELLEIRLNVLNDVVDCFVLTESPFTVSGKEKPLYYQENKDRFGKFNDKIIHNITETIPNDFSQYLEKRPYHTAYGSKASDLDPSGIRYVDLPIRFQRAIYNRECSMYGILKSGANDEDIIITSDADEIVNPLVLKNLDWFDHSNHYVALQKAFYYNLNTLYQEDWLGSRICSLSRLKKTTVDRHRQEHPQAYKIEQGGWHWSFFGDADNFRLKIESYEHTENNTEDVRNNAESRIDNNLDPLGRSFPIKVIPIDDSYPQYIFDNQEKYSQYIKLCN